MKYTLEINVEEEIDTCSLCPLYGCDNNENPYCYALQDDVENNQFNSISGRCPLKKDTSVSLTEYETQLNKQGKTCFG